MNVFEEKLLGDFLSGTYLDSEHAILYWNPSELKANIFEIVGFFKSALKAKDLIFPLKSIDSKYQYMCAYAIDRLEVDAEEEYRHLIELARLFNSESSNQIYVKQSNYLFAMMLQYEPLVVRTSDFCFVNEEKIKQLTKIIALTFG